MEAADIYSAGIILYIMRAGEFPFLELRGKSESDGWSYKKFLEENRTFWTAKGKAKGAENFFGEEFIELINRMLDNNGESRITVKEIKASKWYNGPVLVNTFLKEKMESPSNSAVRRGRAKNSRHKIFSGFEDAC